MVLKTLHTTRRTFLKNAAAASSVLALPMINIGRYSVFAGMQDTYSKRAIDLVMNSLVIDMLNNFSIGVIPHDFVPTGKMPKDELERYLQSGINVFALGDQVENYDGGIKYFEGWNKFLDENDSDFYKILTERDLDRVVASNKFGIMYTHQKSNHFRKPSDVDTFFQYGQRLSQLMHNWKNHLGFGAFEDIDEGLTDIGAEIVRRMNEVGMAVDIAHCGDKTAHDAIDICTKPILITHASCRALIPGYARAKTDEHITKMAKTGGVIGIPMLRFMIRDREPVTIEHYIDHIDYAVKLVGIEHVGIGSDMVGLDTEDALPEEERIRRITNGPPKYKAHTNEQNLICIEKLNHPKRMFDLTEGLIRRGYNNREIKALLGLNFKRALAEIWDV